MFKKNYSWCALYAVVLLAFTLYIVLDTFVIEREFMKVEETETRETTADGGIVARPTLYSPVTAATVNETLPTEAGKVAEPSSTVGPTKPVATAAPTEAQTIKTDTRYKDEFIEVNLTTYREYETEIHVADIVVSDMSYFRTALANNSYGRNITEKTSDMAENNNAVIAVNGDFYGARTKGYVIRNGRLYRSESVSSSQEDAVFYVDGTMKILTEGERTAEALKEENAWQVFSFGPGLLINGEISVTKNQEVDQSMASNPRTAVGMIAPMHFVLIVCDGRTDESAGLSLFELASFMKTLGVTEAYNLDGGGSSTMYFNGKVVNYPTTNGKLKERKVSDIVYIG